MRKHKNKFRKLINDLHLWLGLGAGIILFIVCLSGTIYTFRSEIEYCLNPSKYKAEAYKPGELPIQIESLISTFEKQENGKVVSVFIPEDKSKNYKFSLRKNESEKRVKSINKDEKKGTNGGRPVSFYIDPYSGKTAGKDRDKVSAFFLYVMKAHRWLLLDSSIGRPVVGIATLIFVFLSISGLFLWFPKKFKHWKRWTYWKPGFKIKFNGNWKRINHDLHNTLGFYSLILLLIMALTGLCWSFDWYRDGVSNLMHSEVFAGRKEKSSKIAPVNGENLSISKIIDITDKNLTYPGDINISLPKDSVSAISARKNKNGFFALSVSDKIEIHPNTGMVIRIDKFEEKPLNVQVVSLIKPIHLGEVYGVFSKIIYFICCLIGTSLPVTGTLIWINKIKKNKKLA